MGCKGRGRGGGSKGRKGREKMIGRGRKCWDRCDDCPVRERGQ